MKKFICIICLIFLFSCGTDDSEDNEPEISNNPLSANLIFPYKNSLCNEGTDVSPTQSTVLFEWSMSANTDNYTLNLTNISTGNLTSHETTDTQITIVLDRATQYRWFVISQSNTQTTTAQSEVWNFYNAGPSNQNYAPFPAEIVSPIMAETINTASNEITLTWNGSDIDNDIIGFDVYFGTDNPPAIFISDLSESNLIVPISPTSIYYWYIITKDAEGNSSNSGIYQFRIE